MRESMRTIARWNLGRFDLRTLVVLGLSLLLAACNNGDKAGVLADVRATVCGLAIA
jgi:predicted small secreted protein